MILETQITSSKQEKRRSQFNNSNRWYEYENLKKKIEEKALSPKEHEKVIYELTRELKI